MSDITDRLITACNDAPATIPWPHRLLHDAVAEIRDLRVELAAARNEALREAKSAMLTEACFASDTGDLNGIEYFSRAQIVIGSLIDNTK